MRRIPHLWRGACGANRVPSGNHLVASQGAPGDLGCASAVAARGAVGGMGPQWPLGGNPM